MKNKLLFGIIIMLFIAMFSIFTLPKSVNGAEWDNVKSYNPEIKTAIIDNWYGIGGTLAEITLIDNTYYCLENCEATIKLDLKEKYKAPLKNLIFIPNITSYELLQRDDGYECLINDYENICNDNKIENNTIITCENKIVGSHIDTCYNWSKFNVKQTLNIGVYYIKLKGQKETYDNIEWIPNFLGVDITEWASWNYSSSLNLTAWFTFNNTINDNLFKYNLTLAANTPLYVSGVFGNATNFSTNPPYLYNSNITGVPSTLGGTIEAWVYLRNFTGGKTIWSCTAASSYNCAFLGWGDNQNAGEGAGHESVFTAFNYQNSNFNKITYNDSSIVPNKWYHIAWSWNQSNMYFYLNGTLVNTTYNNYQGGYTGSIVKWTVGSNDFSNNQVYKYLLNGYLDEMMIWNMYRNASEIQSDMNQIITTSGNTPPIIYNITLMNNVSSKVVGSGTINGTTTIGEVDTGNLLNISFTWYQGTAINISNNTGKHSMPNATNINANLNITLRVPYNLTSYSLGYNYSLGVYACDGTSCVQRNSSNVTITYIAPGDPPTSTTPIINSTLGTNTTNENLTCYNQSTNGGIGYNVTNVYNWNLNNKSITLLNLPFEGGSNATYTKDYSNIVGYGNVTAAIYNSTGGYDGFGAYEFDGINDGITFSKINIADSITYSAWVKAFPPTDAYPVVVALGVSTPRTGIHSNKADSPTVRAVIVDAGGKDCSILSTGVSMNKGIWTHIALTYSNSTNETIVYKNGVRAKNQTFAAGCVSGFNNPSYGYIGQTQYFNGTIDDVMIFNRSLSAEEIKFIYENKTNMISSAETKKGDIWHCSVTPVSEAGSGITMNSTWLRIISEFGEMIINYTPSIDINTTEGINSSITNAGSGWLNIIANWWNGAVIVFTEIINNIPGGSYVTSFLGIGNYSEGDNITLQIITNQSEIFNGSTLTIEYTNPEIYNVTIEKNTSANYYHTIMNCSTTFKIFSDNATLQFMWFNQTGNIDQLNSTTFVPTMGKYTLYSPFNLTYLYQNVGYNYTCNISLTLLNGTQYNAKSITTQIVQQINDTTTYNSNVTEGSLQLISGNVTWMGFINTINATLIYDNITYSTIKNTQANSIWFNVTIGTPMGRPASYFKWNFTAFFNDGNNESNILSQTYQQNFTTFTIDNCTNNTLLAINFTLKDEETKITIASNTINSTIEVDFIIRNRYNPQANWTYNHLWTNLTNAKICVKPESLNQTGIIVVEGVVSYKSESHVQEYYYFDYLNLSNNTIPHNINLYDLASAKSTSFLVTYYDCQYTKITGAIINVLRRYIADGEYLNVEMGKTSIDGQTILHLTTEDVLYKYWINKDGKFLWLNPESPAICLSAPCQLNIYQQCEGSNPTNPSVYDNIIYDLISNRTDRTIILTYNSLDGSSPTMTMNITRFTNYMNDSVCTETQTGAGGTLTCTIPLSLSNSTYYIDVKKNGKSIVWGFFDFSPDASTYFGKSGLLLSSLAILSLVLMGATTSGVAVIIFALLGLIFSSLLYFLDMGYGTLIWVVIAGIIIIFKIARRQSIR